MPTLVVVALAGFVASLVDGSLGMGFGPTSSTILLAGGLAPAAVSTTVNVAKVATGIAGGAAHWRFGNVDRRLVLLLALPGCAGALLGVTVLANVDGDTLRPYLAVLLLVVGTRMLLRFTRLPATPATPTPSAPTDAGTDAGTDTDTGIEAGGDAAGEGYHRRGIGVAAFAGGVTNGLIGAWGPVVTPVLLGREGLAPRHAVGSVNTAEVAVALTASTSLLASVGADGVEAGTLLAMLVGGLAGAPLAAWTVQHLRPRSLGVGASTLLLVTAAGDLAEASPLPWLRWPAMAVLLTVGALAFRSRPTPATGDEGPDAPDDPAETAAAAPAPVSRPRP
ncbi:MAG TPA: sulfite exporter TauE/SafE family protein [Acidimicrobiales bacterium]